MSAIIAVILMIVMIFIVILLFYPIDVPLDTNDVTKEEQPEAKLDIKSNTKQETNPESKQVSDITNPIPDFNLDPCILYKNTDTNINDACTKKIWEDKCKTANIYTASDVDRKWASGQTLQDLKNDANAWATLDTEKHRKGCHNMTREQYNKNSCAKYKDTDKNIDDLCLKTIWEVNCSTPTRYLTDVPSIPWAKLQTLRKLKDDANNWSITPTDTQRKGCYNMTNDQYNVAMNNNIIFKIIQQTRDAMRPIFMKPQ
jgi:hypothetical protein